MKIEEITIENFKSINSIQIYPSEGINIFIGENSVGKSNIFDAINWLLGSYYPTFNSTKDEDHYLGCTDSKIKISINFNDGANLSLDESRDRFQFSILKDGSRQANNEAREKYSCAYLGVDRQILDYLPSN
jgi:predicted ATP-dependent endonuclease of OLD family